MSTSNREFGDAGEKIARRYLENKSYVFVEQNYQKPWGEIDLVFKKGDALIFVEVKTRDMKNVKHYLPEYSVGRRKIRRLQNICETYLAEKKLSNNQKWQIDVISIAIDKYIKKARIKHIENAIWEEQY